MKVYVIMGNDYPDAVFVSEQAASDYATEKREHPDLGFSRIHWRYYEFELQGFDPIQICLDIADRLVPDSDSVARLCANAILERLKS